MSYLLYGITLLAIIAGAYARLHNSVDQSEYVEQSVDTLLAQIEIIKSKIFLCGAIYPDGDHGQFAARYPYPAPSNATHRDLLSNVTCPGAPSGSQTLNLIGDGIALPIPPKDFGPWEYEHTLADGIRLHLVPAHANGAAAIRTRLLRQLGSAATESGDDIAILVLK